MGDMGEQMESKKRPGRPYRVGHAVINLSVPPSFLSQVNELCRHLGVSRSELFRESVSIAHPEVRDLEEAQAS